MWVWKQQNATTNESDWNSFLFGKSDACTSSCSLVGGGFFSLDMPYQFEEYQGKKRMVCGATEKKEGFFPLLNSTNGAKYWADNCTEGKRFVENF